MTKLSIAFLVSPSLAAIGCHENKSSGDATTKITAIKERMCACKDKACIDKVSEELAEWGQEQEKAWSLESLAIVGDEETIGVERVAVEECGAMAAQARGEPESGGSGHVGVRRRELLDCIRMVRWPRHRAERGRRLVPHRLGDCRVAAREWSTNVVWRRSSDGARSRW